jgi:hypothetical protein
MGFNRRKMEAQRREAAERSARGHRAPNRRLEQAPGQANADAVFADDRRRYPRGELVKLWG